MDFSNSIEQTMDMIIHIQSMRKKLINNYNQKKDFEVLKTKTLCELYKIQQTLIFAYNGHLKLIK